MEPLNLLEEAAQDLDTALKYPGDCSPGLPDGRSLLYGPLAQAEVHDSVREAVDFASAKDAVLVLAFLGHGFTPGVEPRLLYMVHNSENQKPLTAVDLNSLVAGVADSAADAGTIVIVDTCHAGAVATSAASLAVGVRGGQVRLEMLLASTAAQAAYGLALSSGLAAVMRDGLPNGRRTLGLAEIKAELERRDLVPSSDLGWTGTDGVFGGTGLWLARNRLAAHTSHVSPAVVTELVEVLGPLLAADQMPFVWDRAAFASLREGLRKQPVSELVQIALDLLDDVEMALGTAEFLRDWLGPGLTTERLRRGLLLVDRPLYQETAVALADAIGHLALNYPAVDRGCGRIMARYVAAVGLAAGRGMEDREPQEWARTAQVSEHLNDAVAEFGTKAHDSRLRLIVGLRDSITGQWPRELEVWLQKGETRVDYTRIECQQQTEAGASEALKQAVRWGGQRSGQLGLTLGRVEIAAPEALLLSWHPEKVKDGMMLGVSHDIALRWSERLDPPDHHHWINAHARSRLAKIASCAARVPMDWLSPNQTADLAILEDEFSCGMFNQAVGVDHGISDPGLLAILLAYSPIVLWPHATANLTKDHKKRVRKYWHRMPQGVIAAYRAEWRHAGRRDVLAALRTVWDDEDWLNFCDHFNQDD
jgi:vWA-MoxR associated protein middle region (VMAP-M) 2